MDHVDCVVCMFRVSSDEGQLLSNISVPVVKPSTLPPRFMGGGGYRENSIYMHHPLHHLQPPKLTPVPCTHPAPGQCKYPTPTPPRASVSTLHPPRTGPV